MAQSKIDHFFGQSRGNAITKGIGVGGSAPSDDDEPMIPPGFRITAASDIHAQRSAKRSKFEGEAEECSECDDGSSASDSFVVSDHVSECSSHGSYEDVQRPISQQSQPERPVSIGSGSWLGHGVVVLPGSRIGKNVAVGAN